MTSLIVVIALLLAGFIIAAGYWVWLVKALKQQRHKAFLRLIPVLDERIQVVSQLIDLIQQHIKSEQSFCVKNKALGQKIKEERNKIKRRLTLEAKLSHAVLQLVKIIQRYSSLRANPKVMQAQIALAEIEERIASDVLLFNTLTERYNKEIEIAVMKPFASLLKFRKHKEYNVIKEE